MSAARHQRLPGRDDSMGMEQYASITSAVAASSSWAAVLEASACSCAAAVLLAASACASAPCCSGGAASSAWAAASVGSSLLKGWACFFLLVYTTRFLTGACSPLAPAGELYRISPACWFPQHRVLTTGRAAAQHKSPSSGRLVALIPAPAAGGMSTGKHCNITKHMAALKLTLPHSRLPAIAGAVCT